MSGVVLGCEEETLGCASRELLRHELGFDFVVCGSWYLSELGAVE